MNDWIKARKGTPSKKKLKSALKTSNLYLLADKSLKLDSQLDNLYESLSRYTHTQGFVHSHQGLKTANRPVFSEIALRDFSEAYLAAIKYCVCLIAIHFPNAIIGLPVYQKFGYGGPICFIDQDQSEMVRAIFSESELLVLDDLASHNREFQELKSKIESMPDLSKEQIDETWKEIEGHMDPGPNKSFR